MFIDVSKFIAITLVCIGHVLCNYQNDLFLELNKVIYTFHMPLFMIISGFLSVNSYEKSFKAFMKIRFYRLVIPLISYSIISIVILGIIGDNFGLMLSNELKGSLWYLRCLFIINILVYILKRTYWADWLVCLMSCMAVFICPWGSYLRINFFMLMFWTGFYISKYFEYLIKYILVITIMALLISCFVGFPGPAPKMSFIDIMNDYSLLPKYYLSGVGWSILIIGIIYIICQISEKNRILVLFQNIGLESLGIYGLQTIIIERLLNMIVFNLYPQIIIADSFTAYVIIPIIGSVLCVICYMITKLLNKSDLLNILLLGNCNSKNNS